MTFHDIPMHPHVTHTQSHAQTLTPTYTCTYNMHMHTYTVMHTHLHRRTHAKTHLHRHAHTPHNCTDTHTCTGIHTPAQTYTCVCVCVCVWYCVHSFDLSCVLLPQSVRERRSLLGSDAAIPDEPGAERCHEFKYVSRFVDYHCGSCHRARLQVLMTRSCVVFRCVCSLFGFLSLVFIVFGCLLISSPSLSLPTSRPEPH